MLSAELINILLPALAAIGGALFHRFVLNKPAAPAVPPALPPAIPPALPGPVIPAPLPPGPLPTSQTPILDVINRFIHGDKPSPEEVAAAEARALQLLAMLQAFKKATA